MIYFDNAATSHPKPPQVFAEMERFLKERGGNPGRSGHRMATGAEATLRECRTALAEFFGVSDPDRVIFCLNATDALNLALRGFLRVGDHVVSTVLEHNSVNRPLYELSRSRGVAVDHAPVDADGAWRTADLLAALRPESRLVAVTHCSNVLGVLCPVEELAEELRQRAPEVLLLVDASQTAGLVDIRLDTMRVDLLAAPGHKGLLGPPGTGFLLLGDRVDPDRLSPLRTGGTGGDSSTPDQPRELPYLLEAGTPNTIGVAGLLASLRFVQASGPEALLAHERKILGILIEGLARDPRFRLYGTHDIDRKAGVLSVTIAGLDSTEAAAVLDDAFEICVRPGLHCAPHAHRAIGTYPEGTLRLSPGHTSTEDEAGAVVEALREIAA